MSRNTGRVSLAPGVVAEVRHIAYSAHPPDNVPHRHTYLRCVRSGSGEAACILVEGVPPPVGPGDVFWARPGVLHQIINTVGEPLMELYWIAFAFDLKPTGDNEGDEVRSLVCALAESDSVLVTPARTDKANFAAAPDKPGALV